jgi:uncharacterized membrane-anchored protein
MRGLPVAAWSPDALASRLPAWVRAGFAALLLCGVLGFMIEDRARILRTGAEVRLVTAPIDPRDLFRGDYVVLSYRVSFVPPELFPTGHVFRRHDQIWVELEQPPDAPARVVAAHARRPAATGSGRVVLAGHVDAVSVCMPTDNPREARCAPDRPPGLRVTYGLESYFVPEGEGLAIERADPRRIEIVAAVAPDGRSAIKRLMLDGRAVHSEPPY